MLLLSPLSEARELRNFLGTLNIGLKGDSCFYGATARGEVSVFIP